MRRVSYPKRTPVVHRVARRVSPRSFLDLLQLQDEQFYTDVRKQFGEGITLPRVDTSGQEGNPIPDEVVLDGTLGTDTEFLHDLLSSPSFEVRYYTKPLVDLFAKYGIRHTDDSVPDEDDWYELKREANDILRDCEVRMTVHIHTLNYTFVGNLAKGLTWQGWES